MFGRFHANNDTEHVYRLFRRRHMRTRDTIVSFNYDLIFEQSLPNNSRWYYEGIDDVHEPQSLRILNLTVQLIGKRLTGELPLTTCMVTFRIGRLLSPLLT